MRIRFTILIVLSSIVFLNADLAAQNSYTGIVPEQPKFHKHIALSSAFSYSVINNRKEIRGQYKPGVNFGLQYVTHPWFSWSAEYSSFFKHSSSPGFQNIQAWNAELNGNFSFGMATSDLKFRFVFGMCYLNWMGTFVGPSVNDNKGWYYGKTIKQDWVGANLGFGFSHPIGKDFSGYFDFRARFASEDRDLVSISDTAFLFGIKWEPFALGNRNGNKNDADGNAQNKITSDKDSKNHKKSGSPKPARKYSWLKKRSS